MSSFFFILAAACAVAVLVSLVAGLGVMSRGKEGTGALSNKFMRARVILQGAAVVFFVLALITR